MSALTLWEQAYIKEWARSRPSTCCVSHSFYSYKSFADAGPNVAPSPASPAQGSEQPACTTVVSPGP